MSNSSPTSVPKGARILAFEPFDGGSHRQVRESISRHGAMDWHWITRPPRAWKWRMRLAAQELVDEAISAGAFDPVPDAIVATSLLAAGDLRAALPRGARDIPLVLYMHENQAAYPVSEHGAAQRAAGWDAQFALTNLSSVLAADLVIFNSRWNLDSFIDGVEGLLAKSPDASLGDVEARIRERSSVAWPPVETPPAASDVEGALHNAIGEGGPIVVWPHRWEHDKGPDELLAVARRYSSEWDLRWVILGQQYQQEPPQLATFRAEFADRILNAGFLEDRDAYWAWLHAGDWVLSTARHEFFGIAVVEAMHCGCLPWLPSRLSYMELLPEEGRDLSPGNPPGNIDVLRAQLASHLGACEATAAVARIEKLISTFIAPPQGG